MRSKLAFLFVGLAAVTAATVFSSPEWRNKPPAPVGWSEEQSAARVQAAFDLYKLAKGEQPLYICIEPDGVVLAEGTLEEVGNPVPISTPGSDMLPGHYFTGERPVLLERSNHAIRPVPARSVLVVFEKQPDPKPEPRGEFTLVRTATNHQPNPTWDRVCQVICPDGLGAVCDLERQTCDCYAFQSLEGRRLWANGAPVRTAIRSRCFVPRWPAPTS